MTIHLTQTKPPVLSVVLPVFSVVLPVFNERESLAELHRRLSSVMIALAEPYEIIYVDDGSRDSSRQQIIALAEAQPETVRAVLLRRPGVELDAIDARQLRGIVRDALERHMPPDQLAILKIAEDSERDLLHAWAGDHGRSS